MPSGFGLRADPTRISMPVQNVSWSELAQARWVVRLTPSAASGPEEWLVAEIAEKGVALSDYAGDLQRILDELAHRGVQPRRINGGRAFGVGGWLLTMIWLIGAGIGFAAFSLVSYFH